MVRIFRYRRPTRSTPGEHLLVFDGGCAFCFRSAEFVRKRSRTPLTLIAELNRHDLLTSLDQAQILMSAYYITPEAKEYHGVECITRALRLIPGGFVFSFIDLWGVALLRELGYTLMAGNRSFLSKLTRLLSSRSSDTSCSSQHNPKSCLVKKNGVYCTRSPEPLSWLLRGANSVTKVAV